MTVAETRRRAAVTRERLIMERVEERARAYSWLRVAVSLGLPGVEVRCWAADADGRGVNVWASIGRHAARGPLPYGADDDLMRHVAILTARMLAAGC